MIALDAVVVAGKLERYLIEDPDYRYAHPPESVTDGLALALALGNQFTKYPGVQVTYYWRPDASGPLGVAGHAGLAFGRTRVPEPDGSEISLRALLPSGGVMGFYGRRHRLVADVSVVPSRIDLHIGADSVVKDDAIYSAAVGGGYEFCNNRGFFVRTIIARTFLLEDGLGGERGDSLTTMELVFGYKL